MKKIITKSVDRSFFSCNDTFKYLLSAPSQKDLTLEHFRISLLKAKKEKFNIEIFLDENMNILNVGESGYWLENKWNLKHDNLNDFKKWFEENLKFESKKTKDVFYNKIDIEYIKYNKKMLEKKVAINKTVKTSINKI